MSITAEAATQSSIVDDFATAPFFVTKGGESLHRKQAEKFRFRQVLFSRGMMLLSAAIRLDGVETLYTINMLDLMN